jgi:predicted transcriptional regulator
MTKSAKGKVVLYVEVLPEIKDELARLAEEHDRSVAGEVTTALKEYIARQRAEKAARKAAEKGK